VYKILALSAVGVKVYVVPMSALQLPPLVAEALTVILLFCPKILLVQKTEQRKMSARNSNLG
jgi:hypothetical protein